MILYLLSSLLIQAGLVALVVLMLMIAYRIATK